MFVGYEFALKFHCDLDEFSLFFFSLLTINFLQMPRIFDVEYMYVEENIKISYLTLPAFFQNGWIGHNLDFLKNVLETVKKKNACLHAYCILYQLCTHPYYKKQIRVQCTYWKPQQLHVHIKTVFLVSWFSISD